MTPLNLVDDPVANPRHDGMKPEPADRVARLRSIIERLDDGLVERRQQACLILLAALAGEHSLLIGPPGTAKSELARRVHAVFRDVAYFERLLTRFSVPEELFGPLSISALEEDRYERRTQGFLPEAGIAFIDEVFRANSAILNALLTLLNEREFDNGAGRQRCPLISVIGATNSVPDDEVAEAFFDRFLLRVPVTPVSAEGFDALLRVEQARLARPSAATTALDATDLATLTEAADLVELPDTAHELLRELRQHCAEQEIFVSDRRWVKIVRLLQVAAASTGRTAVAPWDLLLTRWCVAPDAPTQVVLGEWLAARIGVRAAFSPSRLTRVVEAFEAQLNLELKANDLDYDESGRLKLSATDLADDIGDAKGGAVAPRMTYTRRRRYGTRHIDARLRQIDDVIARIGGYAREIAAQCESLAAWRARNLWLDEPLVTDAERNLVGTQQHIAALGLRINAARAGFAQLPRLPQDSELEPEPVAHEPLPL